MSKVTVNQTWQKQNKSLVPATFKRAVISSVNVSTNTVNVYFIENPQTVLKNIALASHININALQPGMTCRVDTFGENTPSSMIVAYVVGQTNPFTVLSPATVPTSSSSGGNKGNIAWDTSFLYICIATNTWRRVTLSSF